MAVMKISYLANIRVDRIEIQSTNWSSSSFLPRVKLLKRQEPSYLKPQMPRRAVLICSA